MYAPRPIITMLADPTPAEILSLELIKAFIGLDPDVDAEQDNVLPVFRQAAIDQGQQITGIVWAAASYRIDGLCPDWPAMRFNLPLSPVFAVTAVAGRDGGGLDVPIPPAAYSFIPSAIDFGRPWAMLWPLPVWPVEVVTLSVTCTAGWDSDSLPASIRNWMLNRVATLYDMRSDIMDGTRGIYDVPRHHSLGLLDRWTVRGTPDG
jgi:uncharacterized phiE125 gp8 family phage protein